jgi:hypothetical protein
MGYTGRILLARTGRSLAGSPALGGADILDETEHGDGWWRAQLEGDPRGAVAAPVTATGAPAVSAYVLDSDCADVEGRGPGGAHWHTYLHPETAAEFGAPDLDQPADEVTRQAVAWSAEAGLTADAEAVRAVLGVHQVFVEDTLVDLLDALGVPRSG